MISEYYRKISIINLLVTLIHVRHIFKLPFNLAREHCYGSGTGTNKVVCSEPYFE